MDLFASMWYYKNQFISFSIDLKWYLSKQIDFMSKTYAVTSIQGKFSFSFDDTYKSQFNN